MLKGVIILALLAMACCQTFDDPSMWGASMLSGTLKLWLKKNADSTGVKLKVQNNVNGFALILLWRSPTASMTTYPSKIDALLIDNVTPGNMRVQDCNWNGQTADPSTSTAGPTVLNNLNCSESQNWKMLAPDSFQTAAAPYTGWVVELFRDATGNSAEGDVSFVQDSATSSDSVYIASFTPNALATSVANMAATETLTMGTWSTWFTIAASGIKSDLWMNWVGSGSPILQVFLGLQALLAVFIVTK